MSYINIPEKQEIFEPISLNNDIDHIVNLLNEAKSKGASCVRLSYGSSDHIEPYRDLTDLEIEKIIESDLLKKLELIRENIKKLQE